MIGWILVAIGGLSVIIFVIGAATVMFYAARDMWNDGGLINKLFAVPIGTIGVLLITPLIHSICLTIYQCVTSLIW